MTKRLTERQVVAVLIAQGAVIPCYRCRVTFKEGDEVEREHVTEKGLGGTDAPENARFSHTPCHHKVTNGTKATKANSSKGKIAKVKRIVGEGKMLVEKRGHELPRAASNGRRWASRPIPSRPFPKGHRPVRRRA